MESVTLDISIPFPFDATVVEGSIKYYLNNQQQVACAALVPGAESYTIPESIQAEGKTYPVIALRRHEDGKVLFSTKSVTMPDSIEYIYPKALQGTSIKELQLPANLKAIGNEALADSKFESISLPEPLTTIGAGAFFSCKQLSAINIPQGVTTIGKCAFFETALTEIVIPKTVETIGERVFMLCDALKKLEISCPQTGAFMFTTIAGTPSKPSAKAWNKKLAKLVIADGVKKIGEGSFAGCKALKTLSIPDSVEEICSQAFTLCPKLETVIVPANAKIADDAFDMSCQVLVKGSESPALGEEMIIVELGFDKNSAEMTINGEPFAYQCHKKPNRGKLLKVLERQNAGILDEKENAIGVITLTLKYSGTVECLKSGINTDMWDLS